jgi:hypothetical protein
VTAAVATVVIVVVASVAYSGFEDFQGVRSELASGSHVPVSASYDQATGTETVSLNITVPNRGLYPLNVTVTCSSASSDVSCQRAQAFVPAGGQQVLHFSLSVRDVPQFLSSQDHSISGTVFIGLVPFATLSVGVNFTSFVQVPRGA